jgi:hypothetical protein
MKELAKKPLSLRYFCFFIRDFACSRPGLGLPRQGENEPGGPI